MISDGCRQRGFLSEHISANGITLQCGGGGVGWEEVRRGGRGGWGEKRAVKEKKSELLYITKYISINVSSTIIQGGQIGHNVLPFPTPLFCWSGLNVPSSRLNPRGCVCCAHGSTLDGSVE